MVVPAENAVVLTIKPGCVVEVALCSLCSAVGEVDFVENGKAHGVVKKFG
jgi:hypothetical protein